MNCKAFLILPLVVAAGCSGDWSTEVTIPSEAIQSGLNAWMPVVLTDYVEEEVPATVTLQNAKVLLSDGTDRMGIQLDLLVELEAVTADEVAERIEDNLPRAPRPPLPGGPPPLVDVRKPQTLPPETIRGEVVTRIGVRYDETNASFYGQDASAQRIHFEKLPSEIEPLIERVCEEALNQYFAENAIYVLGDDATSKLAKASLKAVAIKDGQLTVTLGL